MCPELSLGYYHAEWQRGIKEAQQIARGLAWELRGQVGQHDMDVKEGVMWWVHQQQKWAALKLNLLLRLVLFILPHVFKETELVAKNV